jgi:predicted pyridoxine 5'-phosphate oxidase superfamily flavin-nucleotide-binding protein
VDLATAKIRKVRGKMAEITQEMKDMAEKATTFIVATTSNDGKPNGVPISFTRIISDNEIMLVDNFMYKTRQNIAENPMVAVSFWSMEAGYGYQFKGKSRIETSGKLFDEATQWVKSRVPHFHPKAIVVVKVDEIYYIGAGKDSSIRLEEQAAE